MKKHIEKFHYLTLDMDNFSHVEQARMACEAGAKWIQYRTKNKRSQEEWLVEAMQVENICDEWGAALIICSNVDIAAKVNEAQGVHIEMADMSVEQAREFLGESKIIGGSSHTFEQIKAVYHSGADYVGLGPYKPTTTIKYSHDHLSLRDYESIIARMKEEGIDIPVIAAGGIGPEDVEALMATGVHGVAVCSAINRAENPSAVYKEIYRKLY
ncbi:thiamine phosphate synthase [Solitalea koreensis]|uniref:Thiamine-phosphate synthase n=1 Tax=Solitalea koreensis TaxID=543615 RepID=A0A521C9W1_9SPHI|nr:thiamine phosphate synthase [Solitalea koreensis]SMO56155.1 thiamine-phosphate diphosphorylase [Solitalea koreensis]